MHGAEYRISEVLLPSYPCQFQRMAGSRLMIDTNAKRTESSKALWVPTQNAMTNGIVLSEFQEVE
jgi:hypothetical protein